VAVAQQPEVSIAGFVAPVANTDFCVVAIDVADPGNLGTLMRTAEASGASGVVVAGDSTDPFSPKAVRASAGSVLRVPLVVERDTSLVLRVLGERWTLVATGAEGQPFDEVMFDPCPAILLGSEAHGLSAEMMDAADVVVAIPMAGEVESLNVATAGAVLAFELARRRRTGSGPLSDAR
jgi:RNA methyltransferase, TrmH family